MEYSQHTIVTSITFFSTLLINMSFFDLDSLAKREGLKILRITPKYFPKASCPLVVKSSSESHNLAWEITQALAKTNISQTVLTSRLRGGPRQSVSYNHIRVKRIGLLLPKRVAPYLQELCWFLAVAKYLILNRRDYDLVHVFQNDRIWCRLVAVIAEQMKLPVVDSHTSELWTKILERHNTTSYVSQTAKVDEEVSIRPVNLTLSLKEEGEADRKSGLNPESETVPDNSDLIGRNKTPHPNRLKRLRAIRQEAEYLSIKQN